MQKLISIILILLTITSLQAQEKQPIKKDGKKTLSEADKKWLEEYMKIDKELEKSKKLGKTLDELNNMVGADK